MDDTKLVTRNPRNGKPKAALTAAGFARTEMLASEGNDQRTIAKELGVAWSTFRDLRDRDEAVQEALARGHATLADELTHHLLKAARSGNITAAIYLTKARLGWIEGQAPDSMGKPSVQVNIRIPRAMSDAEFARIIEGKAIIREGGSGPTPLTEPGAP